MSFAVVHPNDKVNGDTRSTVPQNVSFASFLNSASIASARTLILVSISDLSLFESIARITNLYTVIFDAVSSIVSVAVLGVTIAYGNHDTVTGLS